jgi:hypothetical protein
MAASNPFGYNNWLLHHKDHTDSGGDEFLLGDKNDLTAGSDHKDQGNATILVNLANVNMTLAGLNSATGSGVGVFGESDADGTIGVGMGVVGACDMGWGVAGLASTSQIDPNKFPRQVGVLGLGDNVGAAGYGWGTNADGVQGYGHGTFTGVVGFGDPNAEGNGVLGFGGGVNSAANAGGVGVRGIGAGGPIIMPPTQGGFPNPVGVFGVGGGSSDPNFRSSVNGAGVVGVGGSSTKPNGVGNAADGVQGYGVGNYSGAVGFGDPKSNGTGVVGFGGGDGADSSTIAGPGVRGIGCGSGQTGMTDPISNADGSANPVGVFGLGGLGSTGNQDADGVQGVGVGFGAGVAGYGMTFDGKFKPDAHKGEQVGVYGQGGTVVGRDGKIQTLTGVIGVGGTGVHGYSINVDGIGVEGQATGGGSTGVSGESDAGVAVGALSNSGTGVLGTSNTGRGGVFQSNSIAALQLRPRSTATPQGAIAGQLGDLFVTENVAGPPAQGNLWFCSASGTATTAKWVKIA